jgi:hypothetical protein
MANRHQLLTGKVGSPKRDELKKNQYFVIMLKEARKEAHMTQEELKTRNKKELYI